MGWAAMVGRMPLDSRQHIQAAWTMINRPIVYRALRDELLLDDSVDELLTQTRDRIQLAAVEYGLGLFPQAPR